MLPRATATAEAAVPHLLCWHTRTWNSGRCCGRRGRASCSPKEAAGGHAACTAGGGGSLLGFRLADGQGLHAGWVGPGIGVALTFHMNTWRRGGHTRPADPGCTHSIAQARGGRACRSRQAGRQAHVHVVPRRGSACSCAHAHAVCTLHAHAVRVQLAYCALRTARCVRIVHYCPGVGGLCCCRSACVH